jgi:hypothetical protein
LAVDVKGNGGFIVAPPSVRRVGAHAGAVYAFSTGGWSDLAGLSTLRPGALPAPPNDIISSADVHPLRNVGLGARNNTLFKAVLRSAQECNTQEELFAVAVALNSQHCNPPLPGAEVAKIVKSAWRYQENGKNWKGSKERRVHITETELECLLQGSFNTADALLLLHKLRFAHWDHPTFSASPKTMAGAQIIPGWGHQRYRDALAALVEVGLLRVTHEGGAGPRDPRVYVFGGAPVRCA